MLIQTAHEAHEAHEAHKSHLKGTSEFTRAAKSKYKSIEANHQTLTKFYLQGRIYNQDDWKKSDKLRVLAQRQMEKDIAHYKMETTRLYWEWQRLKTNNFKGLQ